MVQPNDTSPRVPEPTQMVAVDVYQHVHEGQNLVTELQAFAAFLARGSAQPDGKTGLFYSRDHNQLSVADVSNLGVAWQHDPSHQRVILAPATTSPVDMPAWTRQVMATIEKELGHEST